MTNSQAITTPHSSFVIRHSAFVASGAFTILELLVVISIIITLAALILGTVGYVQKKGARSRAEAEIAALSAALESYKADNGVYPTNTDSNALDPTTAFNPATSDLAKYSAASFYLYGALTGDLNGNRQIDAGETGKSYLAFKPNQLSPTNQSQQVQFIRDPFGNSYGYSTTRASGGATGYNPTFDLWSTVNASPPTDQNQWVKNW